MHVHGIHNQHNNRSFRFWASEYCPGFDVQRTFCATWRSQIIVLLSMLFHCIDFRLTRLLNLHFFFASVLWIVVLLFVMFSIEKVTVQTQNFFLLFCFYEKYLTTEYNIFRAVISAVPTDFVLNVYHILGLSITNRHIY